MRGNKKEVYNSIVNANIGDLINMEYKGKNYNLTIVDTLQQQGYKKGINFDTVFDNVTCQIFIEKLTDIKPYKTPKHNIKVGDIFYHSWGYEQTNIDFYQVVAITAKTVSIREIKGVADKHDSLQLRGETKPLKDSFADDKIIRKTPYLLDGAWNLNFDYGIGRLWEGESVSFTYYA